jgi:hypothetical protein
MANVVTGRPSSTAGAQVLDLIGEATQSRRLVLSTQQGASQTPEPGGGFPSSDAASQEPSKGLSLILFDEADVVFDDDKGFESAVHSLMETAKCPIILTVNGANGGTRLGYVVCA